MPPLPWTPSPPVSQGQTRPRSPIVMSRGPGDPSLCPRGRGESTTRRQQRGQGPAFPSLLSLPGGGTVSRREQVGCPGLHAGFPFLPDGPLLGRGVGLGGRAQEGWKESALRSFFSNMFLLFPLPPILNATKRSPWHRRPLQPAAWRSPKVGFPLCCFPAFAVGWGGAWGRGLEGPDSSEPPSGCWLV